MRSSLKKLTRRARDSLASLPQFSHDGQGRNSADLAAGPEPQVSPSPSPSSTPVRKSLWDQAYQELQNEEPGLVESFERILALEEASVPEEEEEKSSDNGLKTQDRQGQISSFVDRKIAQMNKEKWKFTIGGKDVEVREKVDQIVKIIMVAKNFASAAANLDPVHAGLPWAGVCVVLPVCINIILLNTSTDRMPRSYS